MDEKVPDGQIFGPRPVGRNTPYVARTGLLYKSKKDFNLYIINKKYQNTASKTEEYLNTNGFECINHRIVMVKDFYKRIQEPERLAKPAIVFNDIGRKPAFKI